MFILPSILPSMTYFRRQFTLKLWHGLTYTDEKKSLGLKKRHAETKVLLEHDVSQGFSVLADYHCNDQMTNGHLWISVPCKLSDLWPMFKALRVSYHIWSKKWATDCRINKPSRVKHPLSSKVRFSLGLVQSNHLVMATVYGGEICSSTGSCDMPEKYTDTGK